MNKPTVIDTREQRNSSSLYESNGKIFMLNTEATTIAGQSYARIHYTVIDATANALLSQGDIGTGTFDYYQGSIAVNAAGQVVIGYNRSGSQTADLNGDGLSYGNVSLMAQTFLANANGTLASTSGEMLLKVGLTSDYHNGSTDGQIAVGRQRWGDYSQVSIDPSNPSNFWVIGEIPLEFDDAANGHPGGTGGSRWGTYIAEISAPVPEPSTYAMMALDGDIKDVANKQLRKAMAQGKLVIQTVGDYCEHMVRCSSINPEEVVRVLRLPATV